MRHFKLLLAFFAFFGYACTSDPVICPDYQAPYFRIAMAQLNDNDTINYVAVRIIEADAYFTDSTEINDTLYANFGYPGLLQIPLNNATNSLSLVFDMYHVVTTDSSINYVNFDTLKIAYDSEVFLNNLECDFYLEYEITDTSCTKNEIDSVVYKTLQINDEQQNNIEIYF